MSDIDRETAEQLESMSDELASRADRIVKLFEKQDTDRASIVGLRLLLTQEREAHRQVRDQLDAERVRHVETHTQLNAERERHGETQKRWEDDHRDLEALRSTQAEIVQARARIDAQHFDLTQSVQVLTSQVQELSELAAVVENKDVEIDLRNRERGELIRQLDTAREAHALEVKRLEGERDAAHIALRNANQTRAQSEEIATVERNALQALRDALRAEIQRAMPLDTKVAELEHALSEHTEALASANSEVQRLLRHNDHNWAEIQRLELMLKGAAERGAKAEADRDTLAQTLDQAVRQINNKAAERAAISELVRDALQEVALGVLGAANKAVEDTAETFAPELQQLRQMREDVREFALDSLAVNGKDHVVTQTLSKILEGTEVPR